MLILQRHSNRHLSLCGVRCNIGTDGIFYPTLFTAALKTTWTFVAFASALQLFIQAGCSDISTPPILAVSVIGFMVIQAIDIINTIIIMVISHTGSLKNVSPRKKIEIVVYISWIIYIGEVVWNVYSTYAVFSPQVEEEQLNNCTSFSTGLIVYKVVLLSHWGLLLFLTTMFIFLLDPFNCCLLGVKIGDIEEAIQEWDNKRTNGNEGNHRVGLHTNPFSCAVWCRACINRGGEAAKSRKNALSDVVHLFRVIFDGLETEYTFLDLLAGFRLQLMYHNEMRSSDRDPTDLLQKKTVEILSSCSELEYTTPSGPKELLPNELHQYSVNLKYYLKYAMASYGWPIHVYLNPVRGPISLCVNASCKCCCAQCQEPQFEGNMCFPHQAAIKAMTGTEVEDIITASFVNKVHIVPFYVVKVDTDERKELIIAIRGTLSIKDALTDASARMKEVHGGLLGVAPSFIHGGIYRASQGVYDHLMNNATFTELASKPEFRIVFTGHSLGAGVASVLAVMFKHHHPDWSEDLRAYCFATPAVFSYALAEKSQSFITTVVNGYDLVPRLTIRGMGHLLLSVKDLIDNSDDTLQRVLCCTDCRSPNVDPDTIQERQLNTLLSLDIKRPGTVTVEDSTDGDTTTLTDSDKGAIEKKSLIRLRGQNLLLHLAKMFVSERNARGDSKEHECNDNEKQAMMFIPGRVMHLEVETVDNLKKCCSLGLKQAGQIKASWKSREDFSGIQVHSSMLLDHGPTRTIDYVTTFCDQVEPLANISYGTMD